MHDMPILRPLAAQGIRPHGKARPSPVQPGHALDVLSTAAHLRETQTGHSASGERKSHLACAVIRRTAKSWGVM